MRSLTEADIVFSDSRDRPVVLGLPLLVRFPELQSGSGLMFLSASVMTEEIQGFETTKETEVPPFLILLLFLCPKTDLLWVRERSSHRSLLKSGHSASDSILNGILYSGARVRLWDMAD